MLLEGTVTQLTVSRKFVESAREEIIRLWNELMVGEEERADFAPFADGRFSSDNVVVLLNLF